MKKVKNNQKGWIGIELMMGMTIATVAVVYGMSMLYSFYVTSKIKNMAENIEVIKQNIDKNQTTFAKLSDENYLNFSLNVVTKSDNKYYLLPLKKPIETFNYVNNISGAFPGKKIGYTISIKNLDSEECNIIASRLAPKFFETFVVDNSENPVAYNNVVGLVKLVPAPTSQNAGRNKVAVTDLVKKCNTKKQDKQIIFRGIEQFNLEEYRKLGQYSKNIPIYEGSQYLKNQDYEYKDYIDIILEKLKNDVSKSLGEERERIQGQITYFEKIKEKRDEVLKNVQLQEDLFKYREKRLNGKK